MIRFTPAKKKAIAHVNREATGAATPSAILTLATKYTATKKGEDDEYAV